MKLKIFLIIITFAVPLVFLSVPLIGLFKGDIWLSWNFPNYLFGVIDKHYPLLNSWKELYGMVSYPYPWDISYALPVRLLMAIFSPYLGSLIYVYLLFLLSIVIFRYYLKQFFKQIPLIHGLLTGLVYASFIPILFEASYLDIKIVSALLPLALIIAYRIYKQATKKVKSFKLIGYSTLLTLLSLSFLILQPRGFIALGVLVLIHLIVYFYRDRNRRSIVFSTIWIGISMLGTGVLYFPIMKMQGILYTSSTQLSIANADSVFLYHSELLRMVFLANPLMTFSNAITLFLVSFSAFSLWGIVFLKKNKTVYLLIMLLLIAYFLSSNYGLITVITERIPYGQLFRSWRIAQYFASFLLPILIYGFFLRGGKKMVVIAGLLIVGYFGLSAYLFANSLEMVKREDISPYMKANDFLKKDTSEYKVLWVPEMGWFGDNTSPTWLHGKSSGQGFPESISGANTYFHYYNQMTQPYTWLASGHWRSELGENQNSSNLLDIIGAKYVILHNDIPTYQANVLKIQERLDRDKNFALRLRDNYVSVYENLSYKSKIWITKASTASYCDGGLRCLSEFYTTEPIYGRTMYLTDQEVPLSGINQIYKASYAPDSQNNMIINAVLQAHDKGSQVLFSGNYTLYQKTASCLSDTHHGVYHDYFLKNELYDYSNNYNFDNCFFLLLRTLPSIKLPVTLKPGQYRVIVKYLKHTKGGNFTISSDNFNYKINAKQSKGIGINYYDFYEDDLSVDSEKETTINLEDNSGTNFIAYIAFIPEDRYSYYQKNLFFETTQSLDENFESSQSGNTAISSSTKISPSKWQVVVNSHTPFILNFAETYNPLWKASYIKNGKTIVVDSAQAYGTINSFSIKDTGGVTIQVEFTPQEWFIKYLIMSVLIYLTLLLLQYIIKVRIGNK